MLHRLLEDLDLHLTQAVTILQRNPQSLGDSAGPVQVRQLRRVDIRIKMQNRIENRYPGKGFTKIVHITLITYLGGTQHVLGQLAQHFLGQVHQVVVITIGLVELKHGEFRIMTGG